MMQMTGNLGLAHTRLARDDHARALQERPLATGQDPVERARNVALAGQIRSHPVIGCRRQRRELTPPLGLSSDVIEHRQIPQLQEIAARGIRRIDPPERGQHRSDRIAPQDHIAVATAFDHLLEHGPVQIAFTTEGGETHPLHPLRIYPRDHPRHPVEHADAPIAVQMDESVRKRIERR